MKTKNPEVARMSIEQASRYLEIALVQEASNTPLSDRVHTLHCAILGYERALRFYTKERYPEEFKQALLGQNTAGRMLDCL